MGKEEEGNTGAEEKEPISQEQLESVDDLRAPPETVRETMARTLKQGEPAPLEMPKDFDDDDKKFWPTAPRNVQEYLLARHKKYTDNSTKLQGEYEAYKKSWDPVAKLMEPYGELMKAQNLNAEQIINRYIQAELYLQKSPMDGLLWLMHRYQVDPQQLFDAAQEVQSGKRKIGLPAGQRQPKQQQRQQQEAELDPNDPVQAEIIKLKEAEKQRTAMQRKKMDDEISAATKEFEDALAEDKKTKLHPYANDPEVRKMMGILIGTGQVDIAKAGGIGPALKQAYDKAVFAHEPTREALFKARGEAEAKRIADENRRKVEKARNVGQSVSGASSSGSAPAARRGSTVRDSLNNAAQQIGYNNQ